MAKPQRANPFKALKQQIDTKPIGARLEGGTVTAVDRVNWTADVTVKGVSLTDLPVAGGMPDVGAHVWLIRQGTTLVAIGGDRGEPGRLIASGRATEFTAHDLTNTLTEYDPRTFSCEYPGQLVEVHAVVHAVGRNVTAGQYFELRPSINGTMYGTYNMMTSHVSSAWLPIAASAVVPTTADGSGDITVGWGMRSSDGSGDGHYRNMTVLVFTR